MTARTGKRTVAGLVLAGGLALAGLAGCGTGGTGSTPAGQVAQAPASSIPPAAGTGGTTASVPTPAGSSLSEGLLNQMDTAATSAGSLAAQTSGDIASDPG